MEERNIEQYVTDLLELSGLQRDGKDKALWDVLCHLLMAAGLHDVMDDGDKKRMEPFMKSLQFFFSTRFNLKERREKAKKENLPPTPPNKEKKEKAQAEKTNERAEGVFLKVFDKRKESFRQECLSLIGQYEEQAVTDFYLYWAEETTQGGKMRWETQKTWNTKMRMKRWASNQYSVATTVATYRMKNIKMIEQKEQARHQTVSEAALERQKADQQREADTERSRKEAGGLAEAIANNPSGILARVRRERQKREAQEQQKKNQKK